MAFEHEPETLHGLHVVTVEQPFATEFLPEDADKISEPAAAQLGRAIVRQAIRKARAEGLPIALRRQGGIEV